MLITNRAQNVALVILKKKLFYGTISSRVSAIPYMSEDRVDHARGRDNRREGLRSSVGDFRSNCASIPEALKEIIPRGPALPTIPFDYPRSAPSRAFHSLS